MSEKTFCIAGPIIEEDHYFLDQRLDWKEFSTYISRKYYFVLHAPRQSGKTTAIKQIVQRLNAQGKYTALYINVESSATARDDFEKALIGVVHELANAISEQLDTNYAAIASHLRCMAEGPISVTFLLDAVRYACRSIQQPLVLFIDEIDALMGDSLLSVLRQIRTGFDERPQNFPQALCLIGLRDVRDYRIWSKEQEQYVSTSSPFNIKALSLRLANFSLDDVRSLYMQHTEATGQQFTDGAIECAFFLTQGQPWLVNALAQEACFKLVLERSIPITKEVIEQAKEALIVRRDTHIDALLEKLNEKRVSEVIDAIIYGDVTSQQFSSDDELYCKDLGLLSPRPDALEIANPIYQQIILAVLAAKFQSRITAQMRYVNADGSLSMTKLLEGFTQFYRENSQAWLEGYTYRESGPHILMLAYAQKLINGGGQICREYALGRRRVDLFVTWKRQRFVLELKIKHGESTLSKGLEQVADYMDTAGAEGHLIVFDRDTTKSWDEKISHEVVGFASKSIHVWTL